MITKNDFKKKIERRNMSIIDTAIESGLKNALEKCQYGDEKITIELPNTSNIIADEFIQDYIVDKLVKKHGFEYDDISSIHNGLNMDDNIYVQLYII